jgi:hypothetical protein
VTATPRAVELVETAALAAADKLADGIIAYDVSEQLVITDACARPGPSWSAARASGRAAGYCSTTSTW